VQEYIVVTFIEGFQVCDRACDAIVRRLRQIRVDDEAIEAARHAVIDAAPVAHDVDAVIAEILHLLGQRLYVLVDRKHRLVPHDLRAMRHHARLDRTKGNERVLRHAVVVVEDDAIGEEAHEVRHRPEVARAHRLP